MNNETAMKQLKDLTLLDRFLFAQVIEDAQVYETILAIILGQEIVLSETPQAEKELRKTPQNRAIRIDVYARDLEGNVYDTEV